MGLALSGCAAPYNHEYNWNQIPGPTPVYEPKSRGGNMSSYTVWGERYHVMDSAEGFVQEGIASWYGKKFHGNKTSNGEIYDMYEMTAAHKNLPIPTYVLVHNLDNGKKAVVRVNDRGPFHGDRIIDLSYKAAQVLGFDTKGLANVRIEAVTPGKEGSASPGRHAQTKEQRLALDRRWLNVQVLTTRNKTEAESLLDKLNPLMTHPVFIESRPLSRDIHVRVGPVRGIDNARLLAEKMKSMGYSDSFVVK